MKPVKRRTATKALAGLALYALGALGALAMAAQVAGTVVNLSGPLMVKKADGSVKVLGLRSEVEQGDTLVSEKNTYAQIKFIDHSEITLKPGTTLTIDSFAYDAAKPEGDSAAFNLLKGGLRSLTGLMGKRNKEKFSLKTPTSTIGIRGTYFIVQYVPPVPPRAPGTVVPAVSPSASSPVPPLPPGLYTSVIDGAIAMTNPAGTLDVKAGQFGFTPGANTLSVQLPANPGLQFAPPPTFNQPVAFAPTLPVTNKSVDCEVR